VSKNPKVPTNVSKGLGGAKPTSGLAGAAKKIASTISKGKAPTPPKPTFGAQVTSTNRMKPTTPIIGANRGKGADFASINAQRMKDTIKKTGIRM
jgi:hypothetical protein